MIFALGIPQLGARNAKNIAKKITNFSELFDIKEDLLLSIQDIGPIMISEFFEFINKKQNKDLFDFLLSININPSNESKNNKVYNFFNQKSFVISGTFWINRNELTKIIENSGGVVTSSISKKTDALILGDNGGSKKEKANNLKIKIIDKFELEKILNN